METADYKISVLGEEFHLLPEKALFWPRQRWLVVADLHWGKAQTLRQHGIAVPDGADDLAKLGELQRRLDASRILVLGDLVHGPWSLQRELQEKIGRWRREHPVDFVLVEGNHDRRVSLPASWGIEVVKSHREELFQFHHEPTRCEESFTWCGHVHPVVRLRSAVDRLRLACFAVGERVGILPAFGSWTGGFEVRREVGDLFAVVEGKIVMV